MKSFCVKKDAFDCTVIRTRVFGLSPKRLISHSRILISLKFDLICIIPI